MGNVELASAEIQSAILCDDVRKEDNGKLILIGVYGRNVLLPSFPAPLEVCVVLRLITKAAHVPLSIRVKVDGENAILVRVSIQNPAGPGLETVATPKFGMNVQAPLMLEVEVSDDPGEPATLTEADNMHWRSVLKMPVELQPSSSSSA